MGGDIFANTVPSFWAALFDNYLLVLLVIGVLWLKRHRICN